jgi:hypothetical protein
MASKSKPVYIANETATLHPGRTVMIHRGERVEADPDQIAALLENGHIHEATEEELNTLDPKVDAAHQEVVERAAKAAKAAVLADAEKKGIDENVTVDVTMTPPKET